MDDEVPYIVHPTYKRDNGEEVVWVPAKQGSKTQLPELENYKNGRGSEI